MLYRPFSYIYNLMILKGACEGALIDKLHMKTEIFLLNNKETEHMIIQFCPMIEVRKAAVIILLTGPAGFWPRSQT